MRVQRDGGLRARVVLGGAGEDFGRGGRGEYDSYAETIAFLREVIPSSVATFGRDNQHTLQLRFWLADALLHAGTDKAMIREAIEVFEDTSLRWPRVFTTPLEGCVETARAKLTLVDTPLPFDIGARVECRYAESDSDVSIGDLFDSSDSGSESGSESSDDDDDDDDDGCWAPGVVVAQHYREASMDVGYYAPYQVRLDSGGLIYVVDPAEQIRAVA